MNEKRIFENNHGAIAIGHLAVLYETFIKEEHQLICLKDLILREKF